MIEMNEKRLMEGTPENEAYVEQLKETAAYQERIFALDEQCRQDNFARSGAEPVYNVELTLVKGVNVLRCNNSKYVASKNRGKFAIIDVVAGEYVCQLNNENEASVWLIRAAKAEAENE